MSVTATVSTSRRPIRSVSSPPPIEPPTDATALTKKKTPTPASVCAEGRLDRPDERRHEQAGPAQECEPERRRGSAAGSIRRGVGEDTPQMLAAAPDVYGPGMAAGSAERRPLLRPRRERDVRGPRRDHRPDRGPGPCASLGRHGRRPEWRRASDLRLGNWKAAVHRRGRPSPMPVPILRAGLRRDAVMKIVTNYFEDRREALFDSDRPADAGRRHRLSRASGVDPARPAPRARARRCPCPRAGPSCRSRLSLGGIALVDLLADVAGRRRSRRA